MRPTSRDIITEVYEGKRGTQSQIEAQERIDWICSCVVGEKILDIGCSQGIVPLLLGRTGKQVFGIDIDEESIQFACKRLSKEGAEVQKRVRYECVDFMEMSSDEVFDTVLITEVLEHVEFPTKLLEKASKYLKRGGTLIVTVPFGINPHPDHKRTYYYSELRDQIEQCFTVQNVKLFGRWIGIVAVFHGNDGSQKSEHEEKLLYQLEAAFYEVDKYKQNRIDRLSDMCDVLTAKYEKTQENYQTAKEWHQASQAKAEALQEECERLRAQAEAAEKNYLTAKEWHQTSQAKMEALQEECKRLRAQAEAAEKNYLTAKEWHQTSQAKIEALQEECERLRAQAETAEKERDFLKAQLAQEKSEKLGLLQRCEDAQNKLQEYGNIVRRYVQHADNGTVLAQALEESLKQNSETLNKYAQMMGSLISQNEQGEDLIRQMQGQINKLQAQVSFLKSENRAYREKIDKIKGVWYGRLGIMIYKKSKDLKNKALALFK